MTSSRPVVASHLIIPSSSHLVASHSGFDPGIPEFRPADYDAALRHGSSSRGKVTLCAFLAILCRKYTGAHENDSTARG
jgi:hypothetical protein